MISGALTAINEKSFYSIIRKELAIGRAFRAERSQTLEIWLISEKYI